MKLKDYKNEDALDLLADIMEPAQKIITDPDVQFAAKQNNMLKTLRVAIKKQKGAIMEMLARIDGEDIENYSITAPQMLMKLLSIASDKDMMRFFGFAQGSAKEGSSGSATGNTEGEEA